MDAQTVELTNNYNDMHKQKVQEATEARRGEEDARRKRISADAAQTLAEPEVAKLCTDYELCLDAYRSASVKSVEPALSLAEVVWNVSQLKDAGTLRLFREKYRLTNEATFSQFKTIGANAGRLRRYKQHLPSAWTTLYTLARVGDDILNAMTAAQTLTPLTTRHELSALLKRHGFSVPKKAGQSKRLKYEFVVSPSRSTWIPWNDVEAMRKEFNVLLNKYGFSNAALRAEKTLRKQTGDFWKLKSEADEMKRQVQQQAEAAVAAVDFDSDRDRQDALTDALEKAWLPFKARRTELEQQYRVLTAAA